MTYASIWQRVVKKTDFCEKISANELFCESYSTHRNTADNTGFIKRRRNYIERKLRKI